MSEEARRPARVVPSEIDLVVGRDAGADINAYTRYLGDELGGLFPTEVLTDEVSARTPLLHLQHGIPGRTLDKRGFGVPGIYRVATFHEVTEAAVEGVRLDGLDALVVHSPRAQVALSAATKTRVTFLPYGSYTFEPEPRDAARKALTLPLDKSVILAFDFLGDSGTGDIRAVAERMGDTLFIVSSARPKRSLFGLRPHGKRSPPNVIPLGALTEEQTNLYASAADALLFPRSGADGALTVSGSLHRLLSAGRPVVGTAEDPSLFEVEDGKASLRYGEGDIDHMRQALSSVLGDRDLAELLGANARIIAAETSWERVAKLHMALYGRLIGDFFGVDWYDQEYYVGAQGGKEFSTGGKKEHWSYFNPQGEWTGARAVMEAIKIVLAPRDMLSVGEGRGTFLAYATDVGIAAKGIDFSRWAVEHPYPRAKGMIEWGDARDLGRFQDNSFDLVFASDLMEHVYVDDLDRVIREIQRVSRRWAFYNNGGTELGTLPPMFIKKNELPPKELQGLAIAGHVILQPCSWWDERLAGGQWSLRPDLVARFREAVEKVDPRILTNWRCVIIAEKVQR